MSSVASVRARESGNVCASTQRVNYLQDASGAQLAWSAVGTGGPAVLAIAGWLSHLDLDWGDSDMGAFHRGVAARRRLIRYDRPGLGLADRVLSDYSLAGAVAHATTILDACGEQRVAVLGRSFSGPVAIALAVAHPERVSHLILFGSAARIVAGPGHPEGVSLGLTDAVERLVRAEWGLAAQTMTALLLPDVSQAEAARYAGYQRQCASPEVVAAMVAALVTMDVTHLLPDIRVPTLILHRRDDRTVPLAAARRLAHNVPGAQLRILEGSANLPYFGDRRAIVAEIDAFLAPPAIAITPRELEVLTRLADGHGNRAIAIALGISPATVARHVANLFIKLNVSSRSTAVLEARSLALLPSVETTMSSSRG